MIGQTSHSVLPNPNHDELALQNFVKSFKLHIATKIVPGNKAVFDKRVKPEFERSHGRPPADRHEIRKAMADDVYYGLWGSLFRTSQEMSCDCVLTSVERQLPYLIEASKTNGEARGSLEGFLRSTAYRLFLDEWKKASRRRNRIHTAGSSSSQTGASGKRPKALS